MTIKNIEILKKQILYRSSYTGTKETDLLYKKFIVKNINNFTHKELVQLSSLFNEISDADILLILTKKIKPHPNYKYLFNKLMK
jgi:succinate dehydrogenase flavin-adding protein (antitoxin of CptAB toxin-antitoxin module)